MAFMLATSLLHHTETCSPDGVDLYTTAIRIVNSEGFTATCIAVFNSRVVGRSSGNWHIWCWCWNLICIPIAGFVPVVVWAAIPGIGSGVWRNGNGCRSARCCVTSSLGSNVINRWWTRIDGDGCAGPHIGSTTTTGVPMPAGTGTYGSAVDRQSSICSRAVDRWTYRAWRDRTDTGLGNRNIISIQVKYIIAWAYPPNNDWIVIRCRYKIEWKGLPVWIV